MCLLSWVGSVDAYNRCLLFARPQVLGLLREMHREGVEADEVRVEQVVRGACSCCCGPCVRPFLLVQKRRSDDDDAYDLGAGSYRIGRSSLISYFVLPVSMCTFNNKNTIGDEPKPGGPKDCVEQNVLG